MTRYGFAIKALPPGAKPFGDDEENEEQRGPDEALAGEPPDAPDSGATQQAAEDPPPPEDNSPAASPAPEQEEKEEGQPPPQPEDDARPWSGDPYNEGDETDPSDAFAAYTGPDGEEAWLDQAPDGTLTGWVFDSMGQTWRYTDPDAWATDVDGAQMTRTHGPEGEPGPEEPEETATPDDRVAQDQLFADQQGG
ncbi:hypothetical protein ACIQU7_23610 [Streptomyces albidoflavus]